jgi:uncharacterized metal-binding protein YceD (DUF177 family)
LQSFKTSVMTSKREYEIAFVGLKQGEHEYHYTLEDTFFKEKGAEDVENMHATVKLTLDKNVGFMILKFQTGGNAQVNCDRCGNLTQVQLWDEFQMIVKLIENPEEMNEQEEDADVFYIARSESHLEVSNWLYEFVILSIPVQNICGEDEQKQSLCNKDVLAKLNEMQIKVEEQKGNSIWKGLEKFKDN